MREEFLEPGSGVWEAFLSKTCHGPQHLPAYVALAAEHEGGRACAFWSESGGYELLIPLIVRCVPPELTGGATFCDASSPYGYAAPLIHPLMHALGAPCAPPPQEALEHAHRMLEAFSRRCAEQKIVSVFVRMHPLLLGTETVFARAGKLVRHSESVYVDLQRPEAVLWQDVRKSYRRQIRRLEKLGFTSAISDCAGVQEFSKLYHRSMERLHAEDFYFFGDRYFEDLRRALGCRMRLCLVSAAGGGLAAGMLTLVSAGLAESFLVATATEYESVSASKLAYYRMMQYGREQGWRFLHLGGGVGSRDDSLLFCKTGLSATSAPFQTWRLVPDPELYSDCVCRAAALNRAGSPDAGFFPLYRHGRPAGAGGAHLGY